MPDFDTPPHISISGQEPITTETFSPTPSDIPLTETEEKTHLLTTEFLNQQETKTQEMPPPLLSQKTVSQQPSLLTKPEFVSTIAIPLPIQRAALSESRIRESAVGRLDALLKGYKETKILFNKGTLDEVEQILSNGKAIQYALTGRKNAASFQDDEPRLILSKLVAQGLIPKEDVEEAQIALYIGQEEHDAVELEVQQALFLCCEKLGQQVKETAPEQTLSLSHPTQGDKSHSTKESTTVLQKYLFDVVLSFLQSTQEKRAQNKQTEKEEQSRIEKEEIKKQELRSQERKRRDTQQRVEKECLKRDQTLKEIQQREANVNPLSLSEHFIQVKRHSGKYKILAGDKMPSL